MNQGNEAASVISMAAIVTTAPILNEYSLVIVGAVFGGYCAVSRLAVAGRSAASTMLRLVFIGIVFTAPVVAYLSPKTELAWGIGADALMMPVSFVIAWGGDKWAELAHRVIGLLPDVVDAWFRARFRGPKE